MITAELISILRKAPLIASVQTNDDSPLDKPLTIAALAEASVSQGVQVLRLQGIENIRAAKKNHHLRTCPIIGIFKQIYPESDVYITPTFAEIQDLLSTGVEVIALDATPRPRPHEQTLAQLVAKIHNGGALAMADCDCLESAKYAVSAGVDILGTTLSGYTEASGFVNRQTSFHYGPDLNFVRQLVTTFPDIPVIAEGRYFLPNQVKSALLIGALAVVVGGAINDPIKQTKALKPRFNSYPPHGESVVGAVDIGGTWLRFATFSPDWKLLDLQKEPNPHNHQLLLDWIKEHVKSSGVDRVGVSTGGIVDPATGEVWKAKEYLMPDHVGIVFNAKNIGVPTIAWGDGHATAYSHACLPQFAGSNVATIALGTGVGCGFVKGGEIWCGPRGEYPRLNDMATHEGKSFEELLGGIHLTKTPTEDQKSLALLALKEAVDSLQAFYFPDHIVIGGSVGLSDWLAPHLNDLGLIPSPLGHDAGLYGAAALALFA